MEPKKIKEMSNEDYHASPEYSSSQLKVANKDIALFKKKYVDKVIPQESKKCFLIGTLFHEMILEPDKFKPVVYPHEKLDRRLKAYKEFLADNPELDPSELISQQEMLTLNTMSDSLNKYSAAEKLTDIKEEESENEISVFFSYRGFDLRVRPDRYRASNHEIVDLKTTAKGVGYDDFLYHMNKMDYDLSAAMYVTGMKILTGKDHAFTWVVTQSVEPFSTTVYHMDESIYNSGMKKFDDALDQLSLAKTSGYRVQNNPQVLSYSKDFDDETRKLKFGTECT